MISSLAYYLYLTGWKIVAILPERMAYLLFSKMADFLYTRNGRGIQRLRDNYRVISPHLSEAELEYLVQQGMRSYMRYWCDTFRIHNWSAQRIRGSVTTLNDSLLRDSIKTGRGAVVALPHSGNWDLAGAYFCNEGFPLVTVAEILKPEKLFRRFLWHRERMGFEVLGLDARAFVTLMQRAREKRLIALVADRDLSSSGIEVEFFGKRAKMPAGPAVLAIKEGLPLIAAHVTYTAIGIHIDFMEVPISENGDESERVNETVQNIAYAFEKGIAAHPEDWHMLQRIWIEDGIY